MEKKVFSSLTEILLFHGKTTLSELTSVADMPKIEVLKILNANRKVIKLSRSRPKKILRFLYDEYVEEQVDKAFKSGKIWKKKNAFYGTYIIECNHPEAQQYKENILVKLGERKREMLEIPYSNHSIEMLELLGVQSSTDFKSQIPSMRDIWKE